MKGLATFLLIFITINLTAQKRVFKSAQNTSNHTYSEAYIWEAYPINGNIIFGVAQTKEEIQKTLEIFKENNKGGAIIPKHKTIKKEIVTNPDYFKTFKEYCPTGYRILKLIDISALRIIKHDGLRNAAIFYEKKSEKNYGESMEYLSNLYNNFKPYRFKEETFNKISQNKWNK